MRRAVRSLASLVVVSLAPSFAAAQSGEHKAAAEALFAEGRRLMDQGAYAEACKKLEGSQRLDPGAGTLINLAACYELNGQTASAWATYKEAATASQTRHPDWAVEATRKAGALEPRLSRLTIRVAQTPGVVVTRDAAKLEPTEYGVSIPVDPGAHVIEATAPERRAFKETVTVGKERDERTVDVPALAPAEAGASRGGSRGTAQRVAAGAVAGVGLAGVVVGSIFGAMALGKKSDAAGQCTADLRVCSTPGKALVDEAKSDGMVSTVTFIAGGALLVGGVVLFLVAPRGTESKVQAGFMADGASFGASVRGVF